MPMNFSLSDAEQLSPKRIRNRIVRELDNMNRANSFMAPDVFPLIRLGSIEEIYHRMSGVRMPMPGASLTSESPTAGLEDLDEDTITVETMKEKISPEKAVDAELNSEQDILSIADYVSRSLRHDLELSRSHTAWRGYNGVEGLIGPEGNSAHSDIPSDHVLTPTTAFSDSANSDPYGAFNTAKWEIRDDGTDFEMLANGNSVTAYVPTTVLQDLEDNDDLESRHQGVNVQNIDDIDILTGTLPVDEIVEVATKTPRTNADGEPIDDTGAVVSDPQDAVQDNILEPYDAGDDTVRRNIVLGTPGPESAALPWLTDRLAEHVGTTPHGDFSADVNNGFIIQRWAEPDPSITWHKIAQELGFELFLPKNWAIIQDI
jgi:hypothetical protein